MCVVRQDDDDDDDDDRQPEIDSQPIDATAPSVYYYYWADMILLLKPVPNVNTVKIYHIILLLLLVYV